MAISELIYLLEKKLANLGQLRSSAANLGEIERVMALDNEIAETTATLDKLKAVQ